MKVGDITFYGLKPNALNIMEATKLSGFEEGYTFVISMELVNMYNGNWTFKMTFYQDGTPQNLVINGWRINHEYTIYDDWGGYNWKIDINDIFGNDIHFFVDKSKCKIQPDGGMTLFFTELYNLITYSTPKVSTLIYHLKEMRQMYEYKKHDKEFYMEMMDKVSNIENMKKLSNDEISSLDTPNLLEFNLLYMNMIDGVAHVIVED